MLPRGFPRISEARLAMISLTFMLVWVPLPVWKTTRGKWSSHFPWTTSSAAWMMALAISSGSSPSSRLALAAAFFSIP